MQTCFNMLVYSRKKLLALQNLLKVINKYWKTSHGSLPWPVSNDLWQRLASFNILVRTRGQRRGENLRKRNNRAITTLESQLNRRDYDISRAHDETTTID